MNSIFNRYNAHKWKRMIALLLSVVLMTISVSDYGVLAAGGVEAEYGDVSGGDSWNYEENELQELVIEAEENQDGDSEEYIEENSEVNTEVNTGMNSDVNTETNQDAEDVGIESAVMNPESEEAPVYDSKESEAVSDESDEDAITNESHSYQYVTFPDRKNGVNISVNDAEGVTAIEYVAPTTVYRIDTKAVEKVVFTASVVAKYRLTIPGEFEGILEENDERTAASEKWEYSYVLKVSELSEISSTVNEPLEIWLEKSADLVSVKIEGNAIVEGVDENGMAEIGDTVSIEVTEAGYVLAVLSLDEKGEQIYTAMPLDYNNRYEFTAAEGIEFVVADPDTAGYNIINAANNKSKLTGEAGLKLISVTSSAQGYKDIVLNFTAVKNGCDSNENEAVYYEVMVTATPKETETLPQGSEATARYYYIPKKPNENTQSKSIQVNDGNLSADTACTYQFTVAMVTISNTINVDMPDEDTYLLYPHAITLEGNQITKSFSTKNLYYEDKLGFTKKNTTIYTGQKDLYVGAVKYSKKASYLHDLTAVAYDANGAVCQDLTCTFKNDNDELYISADEQMLPGKYKVVVYSGIGEKATVGSPQSGTMYQASTSFNMTVVSGINWIYTGAIPKQAAVSAKGGSFSAAPVGYQAFYDYDYALKAKTQKFTYEIKSVKSDGKTVIEPTDNVKENVTVNAKGKVSINKKYLDKADTGSNYIAVVITAADYAGNENTETVIVELVTTAPTQVPTEIYLANSKGERISGTNKNGCEITADLADGANIVVLDQNGNIMNEDVTITPTDNAKGTAAIYVEQSASDGSALLFARKLGTVTIKASMKNGWKKSKTFKVKVKQPQISGVYYLLQSVTTDGFDASGITTKNGEATYDAPKGAVVKMQVGASTPGSGTIFYNNNWFNWGFEVTGGKLKVGDNCLLLTQTAKTMRVLIWDNSKPFSIKYKVDFVNNNWNVRYENTPKLTLSGEKIYNKKYRNSTTDSVYQQIICTYQGDANVDEVRITPVKEKSPYVWLTDIDLSKKTFKLNLNRETYYKPGSYKYKIAFYKNDILTYKPATITIKVNKSSPIKVTSSYTMNLSEGSVKLKSTPGEFTPNYDTKLMNANEGGKANDFNKYFELAYETDQTTGAKTAVIKFKSNVTQQQKDELKGKKFTGYVRYSYYYGYDYIQNATAKVTIKVK